jgi:hypothetical protein
VVGFCANQTRALYNQTRALSNPTRSIGTPTIWLQVAPISLCEDTSPSPTLAFLEALRAPVHSGAQPWQAVGLAQRYQARPMPPSTQQCAMTRPQLAQLKPPNVGVLAGVMPMSKRMFITPKRRTPRAHAQTQRHPPRTPDAHTHARTSALQVQSRPAVQWLHFSFPIKNG